MDPTIESVIDKTVSDPSIAAKIKSRSRVVDGRTHLDLSAFVNSADILSRLEPQFVAWVSDIGFSYRNISDDTKAGLLDAYRESGNATNFTHALPEGMKARKDYVAAFHYGLSMAAGRAQ